MGLTTRGSHGATMTTSTITTEPMWVDSLTPTPITCSPGASTGTATPAVALAVAGMSVHVLA